MLKNSALGEFTKFGKSLVKGTFGFAKELKKNIIDKKIMGNVDEKEVSSMQQEVEKK